MFDADLRVWINDSWFVIHESNLKFREQIFFKKLKNYESQLLHELEFIQKFLRQH